MTADRESGVFLHVSSLPGPDGIGTLGDPAHDFLAFLEETGQGLWQCCPLGPTAGGFGDSPYQTYSVFAGNPLFVDLDALVTEGWLTAAALADRPVLDEHWVEYDAVHEFKERTLRLAFEGFRTGASTAQRDAMAAFAERERHWVEDYALFRALTAERDADDWTRWPAPIRERDPDALDAHRTRLADEIAFRTFCQFCFDRQWDRLHEAASDRGIRLVGDMPIYVALDSADVWANPGLFDLDDDHRPAAVAGMPTNPDGEGDGQRWGNPLYDWDRMAATRYEWWVDRVSALLDRTDLVRVDHFKGYEEYWAIPADAPAAAGEWRRGPGRALFDALEDELGDLPLLVEDLGGVTPALRDLRESLSLPSMKVAVYADWCDPDHEYHPSSYDSESVAYTSTHDTTTVAGWHAENSTARQRACLARLAGSDGSEVHWDVLDAVWGADSRLAVAQFQDLLGLGEETRLNTPGTGTGNWRWRLTAEGLEDESMRRRLADLTDHHGRTTGGAASSSRLE